MCPNRDYEISKKKNPHYQSSNNLLDRTEKLNVRKQKLNDEFLNKLNHEI